MDVNDYLQDAIDLVNAWEVPEEDFAQAVNDQARIMAGMHLDSPGDIPVASRYASLQF